MLRKIIVLFFISIFLQSISIGQNWHKLTGLSPNVILKQLEVDDNGDLYVLTIDNTAFYSENMGDTWESFTPPPFLSMTLNSRRLHLNKSTGRVFFGTSLNGLSYTSNKGDSWGSESFSTDPVSGINESIGQIASDQNRVVIAGDFNIFGGVQRYFYSENNGDSWSSVRQGFGVANDLLLDSTSHWIVATSLGLQKTTDNGSSWNVIAFPNEQTLSINKIGDTYYAIRNSAENVNELYSSSDLDNWNLLQSFSAEFVFDLNVSLQQNTLLIATSEGLYRYAITDGLLVNIADYNIRDAEEISTNHLGFVASSKIGIQIGEAPLFNWISKSEGIQLSVASNISKFRILDDEIYSVNQGPLLNYFETLNPTQWEHSVIQDGEIDFTSSPEFLEGTSNGTIYSGNRFKLFRASSSDPQNWTYITDTSVIPHNLQDKHDFYLMSANDNTIYVAQKNDESKIWKSEDQGETWDVILHQDTISNLGLFNPILYSSIVETPDGKIFVGYLTLTLDHKILYKESNGSWIDASPSSFDLDIISGDYKLFSNELSSVFLVDQKRVFEIYPNEELVSIPWDPEGSVTDVDFAIQPSTGDFFATVKGSQFCLDCGLYEREGNTWSYHGAPNLLSPNTTPIEGIEFIGDTLPIIRTAFASNEGSIDDIGYYYFSENPLSFADLNEWYLLPKVRVYPNPNNGQVFIETKGSFTVSIFDNAGTLVFTKKMINSDWVDIGKLASGMYLVHVNDNQGIFKTRIVKD